MNYSLIFLYGITTGIFFAASLYMIIFSFAQSFWGYNRNLLRIFSYGALSFFAYGMFSIYCMPLHFAEISLILPKWVLFLGKVLAPIGVIAFIKMFMHAAPIKTLRAFLFWDKTKTLYFILFTVEWLVALSFIFIENRITIMVTLFLLVVFNCLLGVIFSSTALESKRLSKIYSVILLLVVISLCAIIYMILNMDVSKISSSVFVCLHFLFSVFILLFSFIIIRYTIDETMRYESITKLEIENFYRNVYHALNNDEFFLEYQPKMDLKTNQIVGIEALIRWQHPTKGRVTPDSFIGAAEKTELIDHICKWVIMQVLKDIQTLKQKNIHLPVSVNFSVNNICPEMMSFVINALNQYNTSSQLLKIEITESLFLDMSLKQQKALSMLHDADIDISLDDFGAGFSSLRHLDEMGLAEIKIDKAFSLNLTDSQKRTVVSAIVQLSHDLGISVVAEGVENDDIKHILNDMHCDTVQGYGICRPKVINDFLTWYSQNKQYSKQW